jgi:hypothetical protein
MRSFTIKNIFTLMLLTAMLVAGEYGMVKGQRVYANTLVSSTSVTNPANATTSAETTAKINSSGSIQLGFPAGGDVPIGTSAYIKVSSTLGVSLQAYNGSTAVSTTNTTINSVDGNTYYIVSSSTSSFNAIKVSTGFLSTTDLFYIFHGDDCGVPIGTTTDLGLLSTIQNPGYAIDGNVSTSANLSVVLLGTAKETVYFAGESSAGSAIRTAIIIPGGVTVLGNMTMQAFKGTTAVGSPVILGSLLNITLAGASQYTFDYVPAGTFDRVEYTLGGLLSLSGGLNIVEVQRVPNISITNASVLGLMNTCGTSATMTIQTPQSGVTYNWYSAATGGSPVFTGSSYSVTGLTIGTPKTYYVEGVKSGCTNQLRYAVQVTPLALPAISPITGNSSVCSGSTVTLANATSGGAWSSSDPSKATIDATGKVTAIQSGSVTITYTTTDAGTGCQSSSTHALTINPLPTLTSIPNQNLCEGQSIDLTTLNPSSNIAGGSYVWSATQGGVALGTTSGIPPTGTNTYWVRYTSPSGCYSDQSVNVIVNTLPTISTTQTATIITTTGTVSFTATSSASSIKWYDQYGVLQSSSATPTFGPFSTPGTYTYNVVANNGTCSNSTTVSFSVYSASACPPLTKRVYATTSTWSSIVTGFVTNDALAADGNPQTGSTLTSLVGLLGIGTVTQNLFWPGTGTGTISAGTPATIKLGLGLGVLSVIPNISIIGIKRNGTEIGTAQMVNASLLKLLPGENTVEFTITPSDNNGPVAYDGLRVVLGSLLGVGQTAKVFDAYYSQPTPTVDCAKGDVLDVIYGVKDIGVGALSVSVGVSDALKSVDGDMNTYATMLSGVGVLAQAREQIIFSSPSLPSDSIKIITSTGASLLGVNLLTGFSIQRYLGGVPIGAPLDATSTLLTIKLLAGNTRAAIVLAPTPEPYDRIEILYGGVANVLTSINIHEIQRVTATKLPTATDNDNNVSVCKGDLVALPTPQDNCTTFEWYDAPVGGTLISGSTINTANYPVGLKTFYIQPVRFGCRLLTRGAVNITINAVPVTPIPTAAAICAGTAGVFVVSNPTTGQTYNWYADATGGTSIYTGTTYTTAAGLTTTATYYVEATNGNCTSPRVSVSISINPLTITLGTSPEICQGISSTTLPYSALTCATNYNISWDAVAVTAGFSNVTSASFTGGIIPITVPTGLQAVPNTYNGRLKLINGSATSADILFTVKIDPKPHAPPIIPNTY